MSNAEKDIVERLTPEQERRAKLLYMHLGEVPHLVIEGHCRELIWLRDECERLRGPVKELAKLMGAMTSVQRAQLFAHYGISEHRSDCSVYNAPAYPAGECDCKEPPA